MSLTQEKRLDSSFTNNNDHNYLHKKFKKMASTIAVFPTNSSRVGEARHKEASVEHNSCSALFPNGCIAAAHPEIQKIKEGNEVESLGTQDVDNVQTSYSDEYNRLSDKSNIDQVSGHTSVNDEFSNKTENVENDFIRETHTSGSGGRYICPYCKISCAKPSVLQKHIRAHTNERPYPCVPCGFAFKTKSNLYKHRRSRTHALRLQGADVSTSINEDELSGGSESDSSLPPTSISDAASDSSSVRFENIRFNEFSSPELTNDRVTPPFAYSSGDNKLKTIYKPKFRAAFYQEHDGKDKIKKNISSNADFLTEHISKIISDNEAIVDVIETPLQKKYGKIKQIAESKQFLMDNNETRPDLSPLNLTKNSVEIENTFRKRSHSESFSQIENQKHPLNPEGSIIKDLLLKTKANGLASLSTEQIEEPLFICPLCPISYRSADNLEIHRMYYCKGANGSSALQKEGQIAKRDAFVRSNSINVRLPESPSLSYQRINTPPRTPPLRNKPDNLVIIKPESNEVIAPLPSPGPLLGNTRLVDSKAFFDNKKNDSLKLKSTASPKRKIDSTSDIYVTDNISPRSIDLYHQPKIRCVETGSSTLRSLDEISQHMRHNSTSLQMFGGEVKIVDHSGSTTTLRIEPSKNQLSPILIQQNLSPSKLANDSEASSVVVRSSLQSGGTIVHNPPTPKEVIGTPQTPRISISSAPNVSNTNVPSIHDITHFQFPPFNAITAFNPLTLPPLSPTASPNGATTILHGGKLIPHVPGMPGPNTPGVFVGNRVVQSKSIDVYKRSSSEQSSDNTQSLAINQPAKEAGNDRLNTNKSPNLRSSTTETEKHSKSRFNIEIMQNPSSMPTIKVTNVDEPNLPSKPLTLKVIGRQDVGNKRNFENNSRSPLLNTVSIRNKNNFSTVKQIETKSENEIRNFNFENLITKAEIYNNQIPSSAEVQKNTNAQETPNTSVHSERSETLYFQKSTTTKSMTEDRKPKFLRPSTLPLKPGTFTPKRHHGITPNANTMPLVSPETPRPAKAYGQLYLNGNAYTYLGLKCSTKAFYCTINRPQPTYVPNQHFLSMYSNWQLLSELTPDPLGLSASSAMALYDSRHRPQSVAVAVIKQDLILTHSSQWNKNMKDTKQMLAMSESRRLEENKSQFNDNSVTPKKELTGGFESNEEYTYVRGRGRGRYVCSECGIRCKKPSMLKKHIRTHTDVRPYTCIHCAFSFKTKGNLTKHMKSKAHYKKCCELGINPNEGTDMETGETAQCSGETDDETDSEGEEGNEGETESSDTEFCKSRLPEHEAAHCLLSLGGSRPITSATPGLITSARPTTYPYTPQTLENTTLEISPETVRLTRSPSIDSRLDVENEPMDLSKSDLKSSPNMPEIPTARESSVLASLASNTAKLPQHHTQWTNGEPLLHTYLTERALLDSKIKQSQLTVNLSKLRKVQLEKQFAEKDYSAENVNASIVTMNTISQVISPTVTNVSIDTVVSKASPTTSDECNLTIGENIIPSNVILESKRSRTPSNSNAENAKHVVSEYLKHARINLIKTREESFQIQNDGKNELCIQINPDENSKTEDINMLDGTDMIKLPSTDHDPVARKVVIGAGGVAFKVSKGKEFDGASPYSPGRLMEDGRRVCDFCNKTFTKSSQLRLHLNIHYMERPFRCSACAVSFRTRGHLQKHERSGSHHNKVSMTSTFGAATSLNPRPFRCTDCNIAFRIHGHLAKHLRSKMHVMRLECLFKLPFGTFTEIERAGVSLTDIDTTDCASSLASLQSLARKLHEKDPTKLEYRDSNSVPSALSVCRESSEDEDNVMAFQNTCESERDNEMINEHGEVKDLETRVKYSATDN